MNGKLSFKNCFKSKLKQICNLKTKAESCSNRSMQQLKTN